MWCYYYPCHNLHYEMLVNVGKGVTRRGLYVEWWRVLFGILYNFYIFIPPATKLGGVYWIQPVCLSVCPSVRLSVCPLTFSCPPCSIYSSWWILSIFGTNDQQHERVCRMWWPLTLTYIFKVIWPWLRKSCPLCSIYSSGWILFWCGTNDCYQ